MDVLRIIVGISTGVVAGPLRAEIQSPVVVQFILADTKDDKIRIRKNVLEDLVKDELEKVPGIKVTLLTEKNWRHGDNRERVEEFLRQEKASYYLKGEFLPPLGDEWILRWELFDLQVNRDGPLSLWPSLGRWHLKIHADSRMDDIQAQVVNLKQTFQKVTNIKDVRRILVSCFQLLNPENTRLKALQAILPTALPRYLMEALKKKGYKAEGLDTSDVYVLCIQQQKLDRLDEHKRRADYVVEGIILMPDPNEMNVIPSVTRERTPVTFSAFKKRVPFDYEAIPRDLAKFIIYYWSTVE